MRALVVVPGLGNYGRSPELCQGFRLGVSELKATADAGRDGVVQVRLDLLEQAQAGTARPAQRCGKLSEENVFGTHLGLLQYCTDTVRELLPVAPPTR